MKRIIFICEGRTEQEFCKNLLQPYFNPKNITISPPLIKKSGGGIVKWEILKNQIKRHLQESENVLVTTFIDYYGIEDKHNFPQWRESKQISDKNNKMDFLEKAMEDDINNSNFIPYMQLHEFEGLLFNNIEVFKKNFQKDECHYSEIQKIIEKYPNAELINEGSETAPSKRLKNNIKNYNKSVYGVYLAEEIGIENIMNKNPRFKKWIEKINKL